jgi:hypothetical protein
MKTYEKYRKLAITYWEALNDNNLTSVEKRKDAKALNRFFEKILFIVYFFFGTFSLISLYFFTTRVIF